MKYEEKSKQDRMNEAEALLNSLNADYKRIDTWCFRIFLKHDYFDFWPTSFKWSKNSGKTILGPDGLYNLIRAHNRRNKS